LKKLVLISTVVAAALTLVAVASAAVERNFNFRPLGSSRVTGEGTIKSLGSETGLTVVLRGMTRGQKFKLMLATGTCAHRTNATTAGVGQARPDGTSYTSSLLRKRGAPLKFKAVADGKHVMTVVVAKKAVACAAIPA
jgi:hypothetical protein